MENHLATEKQTNETEKKQWVAPEMQEMNINGGIIASNNEGVFSMGQNGSTGS